VLYQLSYSGTPRIVASDSDQVVAVRGNCNPCEVDHPKAIGDRTTLAVMLALREIGYAVLVPFGENTRYDLVIDDGHTLSRVQCKTGRLRLGSIVFATCSRDAHHPKPKVIQRQYQGQVDYFGVYCPQTGGTYLVPIEQVPTRRAAVLRVLPSRNRQRKKIRWAADYEIAEIALTPGLRASAGA
jgi:PD-(D/E)XK endonuclease